MKYPFVSIIIPTYNRAELTGETLDSVIAQTYQNWECIIVDDGSTDNLKEVIGEYLIKDSRFQFYHRPAYRLPGGNAARNYGFELSKGEYVQWLDSDDLLLENSLQLRIDCLIINEYPETVIANNRYADFQMTKFRDSVFPIFNDKEELLYLYGTDQIQLPINAFLWKKLFLRNKPLFDENLLRYQDNDFNIRMIVHLQNYAVVNTVLATIRGDSNEGHRISSVAKTSSKKLLDIFEYRFRSLQLFNYVNSTHRVSYIKIVSRKAIWAFYLALRSNATFLGRVSELYKYKKKIREILMLKESYRLKRVKSYLYLLKLVVFR